MKENYKYWNQIYSTQLILMEKKKPRKKIIDRGKSVEQNGSIFMMYQWVLLGKLKDCEYFVVRNLAYL